MRWNFGDILGEGIFVVYECEQSTPSLCVRHFLMKTHCKCVCVIKYEFILEE